MNINMIMGLVHSTNIKPTDKLKTISELLNSDIIKERKRIRIKKFKKILKIDENIKKFQ